MQYEALTSAEILRVNQPERLFSNDAEAAKREYRMLVKLWHPDQRQDDDATHVFAHLSRLYAEANEKITKGTWIQPNVVELRAADGKLRRIRYKRHFSFEMGDCYIGDTIVAYVVRNDFADLFENARRIINGFSFADDAMEKAIKLCLPYEVTVFHTSDLCVMVMKKTSDLLLLRDVLDYYNGTLDPKHVAWIQNRLHNLACYLEWAKLTHNAINADTVFISPLYHSAALLGGWWYATPHHSTLSALPQSTIEIAPPSVLREKKADYGLDLQLVRANGRELLGDRSGMLLGSNTNIPTPMVDFLKTPSAGKPRADFHGWRKKVLPASFGPPKFVKWELNATDLYKED